MVLLVDGTYKNGIDTINFCLVLEESKVSHISHDAGEALQSHLVQVRWVQTQQRVLEQSIIWVRTNVLVNELQSRPTVF
jgi:hypothetical protein